MQCLYLLPHLTHLDLSNSTNSSAGGINKCFPGIINSKITSLDISYLTELPGEEIHSLVESLSAPLVKFNASETDIKSETIRTIMTTSRTSLTDLRLSWCDNLPITTILDLAFTFSSLTILSLQCMEELHDADAAVALEKLTALKRVNLNRCPLIGDDTMRSLARNCPYLVEVHVDWVS